MGKERAVALLREMLGRYEATRDGLSEIGLSADKDVMCLYFEERASALRFALGALGENHV